LGSIKKEDICREILLSCFVYFGTIYFPLEEYLESKAPPRVTFFAWMAALGKILILDKFMQEEYYSD
jgi:hypothetical protein